MKQLLLDLIPPPAPTLANFVPGRNAEALAAVRDLLEGRGAARVVYLWGAAGSGRSHLAAAARAASPALAVVDDAHALGEEAQQQLFNLINERAASGGAVLATGDAAPRDLALRRDLASRLGSGLVYQLVALSDDEKAAALRAHADSRGIALREDVIGYLLRHARRDMGSLVELLDALDQYSLETGREITLPLLREIAQPSLA